MENLELLKDVLSENTYALVESETKDSKIKLADLSGGEYVNADKYKKLEKQFNETQKLLADKTKELENAVKNSEDTKALQEKITEITQNFENEKNEIQKKADEAVKTEKIKNALNAWNLYNVDDAFNKIDVEKVTIDDDGKVNGLDEQKDGIAESYPHYFAKEDNGGASGVQHGKADTRDAFEQGFDA